MNILTDRKIGEPYFLEQSGSCLYKLSFGQFVCQFKQGVRSIDEQIYKDANIYLQRTDTPYHYELVIESEEVVDLYESKQIFPLHESMQLGVMKYNTVDNTLCITWYCEDENETFIFIIGSKVPEDNVQLFMLLSYECMYEEKYHKSRSHAEVNEIEQFIPSQNTDKVVSSVLKKQDNYQEKIIVGEKSGLFGTEKTKGIIFHHVPFEGYKLLPHEIIDYKSTLQAEFFEFLPSKSAFLSKSSSVNISLVQLKGNFEFALLLFGGQIPSISQTVHHNMSHHFNKDEKTFEWNYYENQRTYTFKINIASDESYDDFNASFSQCLYEQSTQLPFTKLRRSDQNYILNAFSDNFIDTDNDSISDIEQLTIDSDTESEYDVSEDNHGDPYEAEFYDRTRDAKHNFMCIGNSTKKTLVFKDNNIAIYSSQTDEKPSFQNSIEHIQTLNHANVALTRAIMYENETSCLLLDKSNSTIHKLDLHTGDIVAEWNLKKEEPLVDIVSSYASGTDEQTFSGITSSSVFRIDPRLPHHKMITECKKHMTKTRFSVAASTETGYLAVASQRGDIRLFNALNTTAKTTLPACGQPISHIDVLGRFMVATCDEFLILIDTEANGYSAFDTATTHSDDKPTPILLRLKPEHAMLMGENRIFKNAHFSGVNIIASVGCYLITWNSNKIYQGLVNDYKIQKLDSPIQYTLTPTFSKDPIALLDHRLMQTSFQRFKTPTVFRCLSEGISTLKPKTSLEDI